MKYRHVQLDWGATHFDFTDMQGGRLIGPHVPRGDRN